MGITQILSSLAMIAVLILPGFIFGKLKMCDKHFIKGLSSMVINLCVPAIIVDALQVEYSSEIAINIGLCAVLWLVTLVFSFSLAFIVSRAMKLDKLETAVLICIFSIPNTGFIGIPLLNALYGESTLFYSSLCETVNDLYVYSVIFAVIGSMTGHRSKISLREIIVNPPTIAVIIGLLFFFTGIKLPAFIGTPVDYIANATTPIAMFIIGAQLSAIKLKDFVGDKRIYFICFIRLILMPVITIFILKFTIGTEGIFPTVFILMMGMPAGAICSIVAENYNSNVEFATKCVMLSNILCLVTIPIFALLL